MAEDFTQACGGVEVKETIADCSLNEQQNVFVENAKRFYRLGESLDSTTV